MPKKLGDFVKEARARISEWDTDEAQEQLQDDAVLIVDVREPDEYGAGHLPRAVNIPRGTLEGAADPNYKHRDERLCRAHGEKILLYCQTGGRSAMAAATLQDMGFDRVVSLAGGLDVWEAEGLPVAR